MSKERGEGEKGKKSDGRECLPCNRKRELPRWEPWEKVLARKRKSLGKKTYRKRCPEGHNSAFGRQTPNYANSRAGGVAKGKNEKEERLQKRTRLQLHWSRSGWGENKSGRLTETKIYSRPKEGGKRIKIRLWPLGDPLAKVAKRDDWLQPGEEKGRAKEKKTPKARDSAPSERKTAVHDRGRVSKERRMKKSGEGKEKTPVQKKSLRCQASWEQKTAGNKPSSKGIFPTNEGEGR